MDRATIHYLNQKGWSNVEIAAFVGHHRDTIARVLREPLDQHPAPRQRTSAVALFDAQIRTWLDQKNCAVTGPRLQQKRLRNYMTKCSSSTLTGAIEVRSGLPCIPSNRDWTRVVNRAFAR